MEFLVEQVVHDQLPWSTAPLLAWLALTAIVAISLLVLGAAADVLVQEAVVLSERSGLSKLVIGATVVSLGTTTPEVAVSVMAAVRGSADIALGNAVGSIICDTGLILGIACLIAPLPLHRHVVNRQGWVQFGSGVLLVIAAVPWASPVTAFTTGGNLSRPWGFVLLGLLIWYVWQSIQWAKQFRDEIPLEELESDAGASSVVVVAKLLCSLLVVILASQVLIPAVKEAAERLRVPAAVIGATLVAFGTSLPELVTAVTAARRGHGDLAVGNVVGADILNVLLVSGDAGGTRRSTAVLPRALPRDALSADCLPRRNCVLRQFPPMGVRRRPIVDLPLGFGARIRPLGRPRCSRIRISAEEVRQAANNLVVSSTSTGLAEWR